MTTVLITGANGQVGRELLRAQWPQDFTIVGRDSTALDITDDDAIAANLDAVQPQVIVNAAAYTAVDRAETDEDRAMAINATAVASLTRRADEADAFLVHLSTDYVFDGSRDGWYDEDDPLNPIGAYGRTKAVGELACRSGARSLIARTSWVYGALGSNFVTTMLRLAQERDEIGVVADQFGCPSAAGDIAAAIIALVQLEARGELRHDVVHVASPDATTWHDLAAAIFETSSTGFSGTLTRLTTAEYPTEAVRPANSRLDTTRLESMIGRRLPSWRESVRDVVAELENRT